jgi:hypothetical protein
MDSKEKQGFDQTLESAIVVSWADLMRGSPAGLIHIEYGFNTTGTVDYLKVLSSVSSGHWLVACEYWMLGSASHPAGISFENGYESGMLARILQSVMPYQEFFMLPPNLGRERLLQIPTPTPEEVIAAGSWIQNTLKVFGSAVAEPILA